MKYLIGLFTLFISCVVGVVVSSILFDATGAESYISGMVLFLVTERFTEKYSNQIKEALNESAENII